MTLRWLAAAAVALAGCSGARAQAQQAAPEEALAGVVTVPSDWKPQPAIAEAARAAAGPDAEVAAWGEAGLGCFTVVVTTRADQQNPEDALEELRAGLTEGLGLQGWSAMNPADVRGTLVRGALTGELRGGVTVAPPKGAAVTVAACFYNQRDPDGCRAQCRGVLDSLDATKVKP